MGRIFSFIGVFVTSVAGTWWINTGAIGLLLRLLERRRVVRQGSLPACIAILLGIWVVFSVVTAALVYLAFILLRSMLRDWLKATLPQSLFNAAYIVVLICIVLAVISGVIAGFSEIMGAIGAAQRRRFLFNPTPPPPPDPPFQNVDIPMQTGQGRRIVILCDGTSNRPDNHPDGESIATNIWKLSAFLRDDDTQTVWYEAGVGSG